MRTTINLGSILSLKKEIIILILILIEPKEMSMMIFKMSKNQFCPIINFK